MEENKTKKKKICSIISQLHKAGSLDFHPQAIFHNPSVASKACGVSHINNQEFLSTFSKATIHFVQTVSQQLVYA